MNDVSTVSEQARAGIADAVAAMPVLLASVQAMIDTTDDPAVRHSLLELRQQIESARVELSPAGSLVSSIADRIEALAAKEDRKEPDHDEVNG